MKTKLFSLFLGTFILLGLAFERKVVRVYDYVFRHESGCPVTVKFGCDIAVNGPCIVKYCWVRNDGYRTPVKGLKFEAAGTKTVEYFWKMKNKCLREELRSVHVEISSPNRIKSDGTGTYLKCGPQ